MTQPISKSSKSKSKSQSKSSKSPKMTQAIKMKLAKQEAFLKHFESHWGNISDSCKAVSISRVTLYERWMREAQFKKKYDAITKESIQQNSVNYFTSKLYEHIENGSERALLFLLERKGGFNQKTSPGDFPAPASVRVRFEKP